MISSLLLAQATDRDITLFALSLFLVLAGLVVYFFYAFWNSRQVADASPYTGLPLRPARELTFAAKDKVMRYLHSLHDYDNRLFDFNAAAFCRETGRIFPDCITWLGAIRLSWSFLQKRYPGHYVSWGSLSEDQKKEIRAAHLPLDDFQTAISSKNPSPRLFDEAAVLEKPGPLYVDPDTKILLGWKKVPESELEVLIVQKPKKISLININASGLKS